ncbi:hypothetical protein LCGC14_2774130, partial [marine sediment metagenome]
SNVLPVLLEKLSEHLHVSTSALEALEIGYMLRNNCWVIPERDEYGDIIGLSLRQWNDKKYAVPGSKRGLVYVPNIRRSFTDSKVYQAGPHNWTRTSEDIPCPVCGKPDWCMVSAEDTDDPKAVLCCRVKKGAAKELGDAGYLHILKPEGDLEAGSVLPPSELPILIVEGASDVAAAMDLGLVAIGRPSSSGCLDKLSQLVAGRDIIVLGENDAGAGIEGMEKTFETLLPYAKTSVKLTPPDGVKDLRQWAATGISQKAVLQFIRTSGSSAHDDTILLSIAPLDLAEKWLAATYHQDDMYTLRVFHSSWYAYRDHCYREIDRANLRQQLYRFFGDKQVKKLKSNGFDIVKYDPNKHKLDEIMDALLAYCPITSEEIPCWLDEENEAGNPKHILVFPNGYININDPTAELRQSTPHFF